jgi:cytochrome c-type biogenesis protein CcsB
MKKTFDALLSFKTTLFLLFLLGVGAAVATFIENDFGTSSARVLVYDHWWYEAVMVLAGLNILAVIIRRKMWASTAAFLFHVGFVVVLIGAGLTRYAGQEGILHIREGKSENRMISSEPYLQVTIQSNGKKFYQEFRKDMTALGSNDFGYTINFGMKNKVSVVFADYNYTKTNGNSMGMLSVEVCYHDSCRTEKLIGQRSMKGYPKLFDFNTTKVIVEYGSKVLRLPFEIKLRDFQLDRYPGSMAPSSYASEVTVLDRDAQFDYRIYMNHTLDYGRYKFFQSSYDQDEKGTILSVNDDPGKWPTYLGYLMLTIGFLGNLFAKRSRFGKLVRYIRNSGMSLLPIAIIISSTISLHAERNSSLEQYLDGYRNGSLQTAEKFATLIVQAPMGRMGPVDSLDSELLYKLHGSLSFEGLNKNQVIMGMLSRPELWRDAKLIKIKSPKLKKLLGLEEGERYAAFADAFLGNEYKLKSAVEEANRLNPNKRGTFERGVIATDEKLNVIYMIFYGNLFKIYPLEGDISDAWYNPLEAMSKFSGKAKIATEQMTQRLIDAIVAQKWVLADEMIAQIGAYQHRYGAKLIPPQSKVKAEFLYNTLHLFPRLVGIYMILGFLLLLVGFVQIASNSTSRFYLLVHRFAEVTVFVLFLAHTFGLGLRWYISGHAPWSDSYESLLYISWSAMLAGIIFFRRSILVLSATIIVAGIFMFTAHLSHINPQITNLVPVLKSYWLTIHVSVITASYGFLGLGAVVSYIVLLLFIIRDPYKRAHIDRAIYGLMAVTEVALIIGLSMLTVGNFLGAVWANESWGRYWGWDPKETWAYVSIVVYTFVLHLRLVRRLDSPFVLAAASFVAFASILMTYFGVNFYLSGMHSYATGDPVPIPTWAYYLTGLALITIAVAWRNRGLDRIKLKV